MLTAHVRILFLLIPGQCSVVSSHYVLFIQSLTGVFLGEA